MLARWHPVSVPKPVSQRINSRLDREDRRVISELDIWRAVNLLIRQHGAGAASE
jgi:hypothetical protein